MKNRIFLITVMVAVLAAAGVVVADEGPKVEAPETPVVTPEAQAPVGAAGRMVFIDPATGRVTSTPTAEQRVAMQDEMAGMLNQSDEGLFDEFLANGAVLRDLQGRFQSATVIRIAPDGSRHQECTTSLTEVTTVERQPKTEAASTASAAK
ncbi:MAG: hypothetical protein DRJ65_10845 [Acidobacteria bacterium]|nr:MAG: hypothetical protein DRJ65_10845 [Acidobacteriota bacterium]